MRPPAPRPGKKLPCDRCRTSFDVRVLRPMARLDGEVAARILEDDPLFRDGDSLCPDCVLEFAGKVIEDKGIAALYDRVQATWPLDPGAAFGVLPVGKRLHAHPHFKGHGVTMAFLDSGFYPHGDLVARRERIKLYVDATTGDVAESAEVESAGVLSWHGLMTSTVAAGDGFASGGRYAGLACEAELVLIKISDRDGGVHDDGIERGLRWLLDHHRRLGVGVLNLSVGGDEESRLRDSPVDQCVQRLVKEGVAVVAAAGNAGQRRLVPPASAPFAITVGGLDDQNLMDRKAYRIWHSNYGPTVDGVFKPELVAPSIWVAAPILPGSRQLDEARALERLATVPGHRVMQVFKRLREDGLVPEGVDGDDPASVRKSVRRLQSERQYVDAAYKRVEGTSFAAPIISSVAACLLEAYPLLTPLRLKEILLGTAEHVHGVALERQGYGVVNPRAALARVLREPGAPLQGIPYSPHRDERGLLVFFFHSPLVAPVAVVGTFNGWDPSADRFAVLRPRVWAAALRDVPQGEHAYQFLLEDGTLLDDPDNALRQPDGSGGFLSRVRVR